MTEDLNARMIHRVVKALEAYGADRARWPAETRAAMNGAADPEIDAAIGAAARLDAWLAAAPDVDPPAAAVERALAQARLQVRQSAGSRFLQELSAMAAGIAGELGLTTAALGRLSAAGAAGGVALAIAVTFIAPTQPISATDPFALSDFVLELGPADGVDAATWIEEG